MKNVYVSAITAQQTGVIRDWFLLSRKEQKLTKQRTPYLAIELQDATGRIECRWWDADQSSTDAQVGDIVKIEATAHEYRDEVQLNLTRMRLPLPGRDEVPALECFFPASARDRDEMLAQLDLYALGQTSGDLRLLLVNAIGIRDHHDFVADDDYIQSLLAEKRTRELLRDAPAAAAYHHAYLGGLLEHILSLCEAARVVGQLYALDTEMLTALAILHDIGKLWEMDFARGTRYTTAGTLLGHIAMGYEYVASIANQLSIAPDTRDMLLHAILAHHGERDHGSPVVPASREALVFHHLDMIDSRMAAIDAAERQASDDNELFTPYIHHLRSRFLRARKALVPAASNGQPGDALLASPTQPAAAGGEAAAAGETKP